jgi:hypothetical protein
MAAAALLETMWRCNAQLCGYRRYPAALLASFDKVALDSFLPDLVPDASMMEFQLIPFRSISMTAALRLVSSGVCPDSAPHLSPARSPGPGAVACPRSPSWRLPRAYPTSSSSEPRTYGW